MLFSRASRDARVRVMGLMRGKDENQVQLRARLAKLARGPEAPEEGGKFSRAPSAADEEPHLNPGRQRRGAIVLQKRRTGRGPGAAHHISAKEDSGDARFNPRAHPLWYPGADPEWFRPVHTDRHGKEWCLADAALVMQAGARGFLSRRRRRLGMAAAKRTFETVYAIKIQRCWRIAKARRSRREVIGNMSEHAGTTLKRLARAAATRRQWLDLILELDTAARRIQKKFRGGRMKQVMKRLKEKKLTKSVLFVQRGWKSYKRWMEYNRAQEDIVYREAEKLKRAFAAGIKDPALQAAGPKAIREARARSLEEFLQNTNVIGRRNVFRELKKEKMGGDFAHSKVDVKLKDVMHVTTDQVLELNGRKRDWKHIDLKLQECFYNKKTSLDLSTDVHREGQAKLKIHRWPYGLQGNHGMLRLTQLILSHNNIAGLPLDFYRLTNLTDLRANDNRIKALSPEISHLESLQLVWLHYNALVYLPQSIGALTRLDQLALDHNQLVCLPTSLGFLTQMAQLRVDANPLVSPPIEIVRTIIKPPETWDFSIVLWYLRHLESAHTPHVDVQGFGINKMPTILESTWHILHLRGLNLSNNRILELPKWFYGLTNLTSIDLKDNRIERISKLVRGMSHLRELNLRRNRVKQQGLPIEALIALTTLQTLDLNQNLTSSPPAEVLSQDAQTIFRFMKATRAAETGDEVLELRNFRLRVFPEPDAHATLRKLDLADNVMRAFPVHVLLVARLDSLNLSGNLIASIPPEITRLVQIRKLYLRSNSLTEIPKEITRLDELVDLDLSSNQLEALPESIPRLINLRRLRASRNRLKRLPRDLSNMVSLWELAIDHNMLEALPDSFDGMTQLKTLFLDANNLRTLPQSIGNCLALEELSATKNSCSGLVAGMARLPNLARFHLADNCMRSLPKTLASMVSLTFVDLERNEMDKFVPLQLLKNLEVLKLKHNFIKLIPPEIEKLHKLRHLDISGNQVVAIASELRLLTNLELLDLSQNALVSLPPFPPQQGPVFGKLCSLRTLNLRKNHLCGMPLDLWEITNLTQLHLEDNPWTGNPRLKRIVAPHPDDAGGELIVKVIEGNDFAKMDGRRGLSDPYLKIKLQNTSYQTMVIQGSLNPKWNQIFRFELDDNPYDDELSCEVLDWDVEGSDDAMGEFKIPLTRELLQESRRRRRDEGKIEGEEGQQLAAYQETERWYELSGEDDLGRPAKGRVRFSFEFLALDGSVQSVQDYLKRLATRGWLDMAEMTQEQQQMMNATKVRTHNPLDGEWEHDEVRHRDEMRRADRFSNGIKDWLWQLGRDRERWEDMEIFYVPQGMTNRPWDLNKEVFEHQFEDMKEYMKIKEIQDSKNFTARRLRNVERAREKELRRAEYDPEGFFRPGTAASAASVGSAKSASSAGSVGSLGKDAWDRYTVDELRDDVLDFCRGDFEFESTEV